MTFYTSHCYRENMNKVMQTKFYRTNMNKVIQMTFCTLYVCNYIFLFLEKRKSLLIYFWKSSWGQEWPPDVNHCNGACTNELHKHNSFQKHWSFMVGKSSSQRNIYSLKYPKWFFTLFVSKLKKVWIIKQFMVTNCSKERPSSIVTKTLKIEFWYQ